MGNTASNKVLIVGCGDLGTSVAQGLAQVGFDVVGLGRSAKDIAGVKYIQADVTQPVTLSLLEGMQPQMILYCVAAGGQSDVEYKSAYVDGLANVLATQVNNPNLQHVFFVSSTRVYGQSTNELIDESVPAIASDFGGQRLLEAEAVLQQACCKSTVLRLSGIYGPGRLRMVHLAKSPDSWPVTNTWSNRIHRDDAAAFIAFLIKQVAADITPQPCYIVTDALPVSQYEVLNYIAEKLGVNSIPAMPAVEGGKRLANKAMHATGFVLLHPDYRSGYQSLISSHAHS